MDLTKQCNQTNSAKYNDAASPTKSATMAVVTSEELKKSFEPFVSRPENVSQVEHLRQGRSIAVYAVQDYNEKTPVTQSNVNITAPESKMLAQQSDVSKTKSTPEPKISSENEKPSDADQDSDKKKMTVIQPSATESNMLPKQSDIPKTKSNSEKKIASDQVQDFDKKNISVPETKVTAKQRDVWETKSGYEKRKAKKCVSQEFNGSGVLINDNVVKNMFMTTGMNVTEIFDESDSRSFDEKEKEGLDLKSNDIKENTTNSKCSKEMSSVQPKKKKKDLEKFSSNSKVTKIERSGRSARLSSSQSANDRFLSNLQKSVQKATNSTNSKRSSIQKTIITQAEKKQEKTNMEKTPTNSDRLKIECSVRTETSAKNEKKPEYSVGHVIVSDCSKPKKKKPKLKTVLDISKPSSNIESATKSFKKISQHGSDRNSNVVSESTGWNAKRKTKKRRSTSKFFSEILLNKPTYDDAYFYSLLNSKSQNEITLFTYDEMWECKICGYRCEKKIINRRFKSLHTCRELPDCKKR